MPVYLHLLGRPRVIHAGVSSLLPAERRCQLLSLLALRRGWVARSELAAVFWPRQSPELAAANVRKALHFARALPWATALETQGSGVRFLVDTDVHKMVLAQRDGRVADALCHSGALLDGMDDPSCPGWEDWLADERVQHASRWHDLTRARLAQLAHAPADAAAFAHTLLEADPLDEDAMVALLAAQRELGLLDEQDRSYRSFVLRLEEDLGVAPSLRVTAQLQRSLPAGPPTAADDFYGRDREIEELTALLARSDCRLLTIIGPGGIGKSSLAKQALRKLGSR